MKNYGEGHQKFHRKFQVFLDKPLKKRLKNLYSTIPEKFQEFKKNQEFFGDDFIEKNY